MNSARCTDYYVRLSLANDSDLFVPRHTTNNWNYGDFALNILKNLADIGLNLLSQLPGGGYYQSEQCGRQFLQGGVGYRIQNFRQNRQRKGQGLSGAGLWGNEKIIVMLVLFEDFLLNFGGPLKPGLLERIDYGGTKSGKVFPFFFGEGHARVLGCWIFFIIIISEVDSN